MPRTPDEVRQLAKETGIKIVDLKFVDLPGVWQHFSIPVEDLSDDLFAEGIGFDGSSIRGFQLIHESDMLLIRVLHLRRRPLRPDGTGRLLHINSNEGAWNTGRQEDPNLGYKLP